ncbi:MAG: hypothetical protein ACHRXM_06220 [Isosphaerales bacterium]
MKGVIVRLQDFHPSKATIEKGDIDEVVGKFRQFLESALDGDGEGQIRIGEIRREEERNHDHRGF